MRSVLDMCDLRQLEKVQLEMLNRQLEMYVGNSGDGWGRGHGCLVINEARRD